MRLAANHCIQVRALVPPLRYAAQSSELHQRRSQVGEGSWKAWVSSSHSLTHVDAGAELRIHKSRSEFKKTEKCSGKSLPPQLAII